MRALPMMADFNMADLLAALRPPKGKRRRGRRSHYRMAVVFGRVRIEHRVKLQGHKGRP
jgi:hypothetical protein